jgi:hypothetical protein
VIFRSTLAALVALALLPTAAHAVFLGSTLNGRVNTGFGCEAAPIYDPITGQPQLVASGQRTCTYRHVGYINSNRATSLVPGNGRIVRVRVRSGRNPAPLRVTILNSASGSSGFSCCTADRFSRTFRPRANRTTTVRMNIPVQRTVDTQRGFVTTDVVALSAVGPGTLPLRDQGVGGQYVDGAALAGFWYPLTGRGDPRVDQTSHAGLDLMFQWDFRRRRR